MEKIFDIFNNLIDENEIRDYLEDETITRTEEYLVSLFGDVPEDAIKSVLEELIEKLFYYERNKTREEDSIELYLSIMKEPTKKNKKKVNYDYFRSMMEDSTKEVFSREEVILMKKGIEEKLNTMAKIKTKKDALRYMLGKNLTPIKPIVQINQDIATIEKYQDMIKRLYEIKTKKNGSLLSISTPKEMREVYDNNKIIMQDLKDKKFKIISKYKYYEPEKVTKKPLREFLESIETKYNIKIKSSDLKSYIDSI